jgi:hypothetical protein
MTISLFKNGDVLYVIIFRDSNAKNLFQKWLSTNRYAQAKIEDNKLYIYDHNTYNLFSVTWAHGWSNILVWDVYLKRHI